MIRTTLRGISLGFAFLLGLVATSQGYAQSYDHPKKPGALAVSPAAVTLSPGSTQQFIARGKGSEEGVDWSVVSGGGSIDQGGLYVAPGKVGTATVRATTRRYPPKSADAYVTISDASAERPEGYTWCAPEGGSYTFSNPVNVAYGANGNFYFLYNVTGTIVFTPRTFGGDPAPGVVKAGYYQTISTNGPEGYTWCASEGGFYTFSSPVDVAYGANGQFTYKYGVTGTITFDNNTFGDPCPGTVKAGYYKSNNLALGKTAYASSVSPNHPASSTTNGSIQTWWASAGAGEQWIYVDLKTASDLSRVQLIWGDRYASQYTIEGSNDARNWKTLASVNNGSGYIENITISGRHRYVRMHGLSSNTGGYDLHEIQVYGGNQFYVTPKDVKFPYAGSAQSVSVVAQANWLVQVLSKECPDSCPPPSWCTVYPTKGFGQGSFTVTAAYNDTDSERWATVKVYNPQNPNQVDYVTIFQEQRPITCKLSVSPSELKYKADDIYPQTSNVITDQGWEVELKGLPGWIYFNGATSGFGNGTLTIGTHKNESFKQRSYTIYVHSKCGAPDATINIIQDGDVEDILENRAIGCAVKSGSYIDQNFASKAVDNNSYTYWHSKPFDKDFLTVDLGSSYDVKQIVISWGKDYPRYYEIQVSKTGLDGSWATIASDMPDPLESFLLKPHEMEDDGVVVVFTKATDWNVRYVRVNCTKSVTSNGYELHEFQVWCSPS